MRLRWSTTGFSKVFAMLMFSNAVSLVMLHGREWCGYNVNQRKMCYLIGYKLHRKWVTYEYTCDVNSSGIKEKKKVFFEVFLKRRAQRYLWSPLLILFLLNQGISLIKTVCICLLGDMILVRKNIKCLVAFAFEGIEHFLNNHSVTAWKDGP